MPYHCKTWIDIGWTSVDDRKALKVQKLIKSSLCTVRVACGLLTFIGIYTGYIHGTSHIFVVYLAPT